jgi:hypothetical protein
MSKGQASNTSETHDAIGIHDSLQSVSNGNQCRVFEFPPNRPLDDFICGIICGKNCQANIKIDGVGTNLPIAEVAVS